MQSILLRLTIALAAIGLPTLVAMALHAYRLRHRNDEQKKTIEDLCDDLRSERDKRRAMNTLAVLGCGAKVRFVEGEEIMNLTRGCLDEQTKVFRQGGTFIDCNPICPMRETCALVKSLGQFLLPEGFVIDTLTPGATLRTDGHDSQRKLRLVRHGDKWLVDVVVDGVIVERHDKTLLVVPPLLQVLKQGSKENRHK